MTWLDKWNAWNPGIIKPEIELLHFRRKEKKRGRLGPVCWGDSFPTALGSPENTHVWFSVFRVLSHLGSLFNTGSYV